MREFRVRVSRPRWEFCDMYVEADSAYDAMYIAINEANKDRGTHTQNEWDYIDAEIVEFGDCEIIPD